MNAISSNFGIGLWSKQTEVSSAPSLHASPTRTPDNDSLRPSSFAHPDDGIQMASFSAGDFLLGKLIDSVIYVVSKAPEWGAELEAKGHASNGNAEGS